MVTAVQTRETGDFARPKRRLYVRCSKDPQNPASIETQLDLRKEFVLRQSRHFLLMPVSVARHSRRGRTFRQHWPSPMEVHTQFFFTSPSIACLRSGTQRPYPQDFAVS
jgi:hypothetical protein